MKKLLSVLICCLLILSGCGSNGPQENEPSVPQQPDEETLTVDIDLCPMSSTMFFSTVGQIEGNPMDYRGKVIKLIGTYIDNMEGTAEGIYHGCIQLDDTKCCIAGFELVFDSSVKSLPEDGEIIIAVGHYDYYMVDDVMHWALIDARLE
ncbi:MAG: hypothetical protein K6A14_04540 [Erysipelotrichaceae bacterium]|nr:hypothetical protein [Erysipelotrichaceae bacterium]